MWTTIPDIIPITDLRQNTAKALDRVKVSGRPLVVTQRGSAVAVILSVERYEAKEREQEILEDRGHGLREVMKAADRVLKEE